MTAKNALTHIDIAIGEARQAIAFLDQLNQGYLGSWALRELRDTLPHLAKARTKLLTALSEEGGTP